MKEVILIAIMLGILLTACRGKDLTGALVGPTWTLTSVSGGRPAPAAKITAVFSSDGHVSGSGGCNAYSARYKVWASTLTISSLKATTMRCSPAVDKQESDYFRRLEGPTAYGIEGSELTITISSESMLTYTSRQ